MKKTARTSQASVASDQFGGSPIGPQWISDRTRGDDSPTLVNPRDQYVEKMARALSSDPEADARLFVDTAEAWTRWKTAGVPLKIGPKSALHNAMTRTAKQSKRLSQQAAETALMQKTERPPTVKVAYMPPPQVKMSEIEKHTSCPSCKKPKEKCACGDKMAMKKSVTSVGGKSLGEERPKRKFLVKEAFKRVMGPTFAASSEVARKGELVAKTASMSDKAKKVLDFIKRNPSARDAAIWGSAGATMGALHEPMPGRSRLGNALRGGATGAAGGAVAGEVARRLAKTAAYAEVDPKEVLADKLPEKGLPKTPLDQDVEDVKNKLLGAVDSVRDIKVELTSGPKIKKVHLRRPPKELMEGLQIKEASMKSTLEFLKDPATLAMMGAGGLVGGGGVYLANRPKKSLGGKGAAETDLESMVAAQKQRGEEGASFPRRLKNRYVEFSKGLATDFRKNPGQAAALGALTGASAGALAAKMLGAGR